MAQLTLVNPKHTGCLIDSLRADSESTLLSQGVDSEVDRDHLAGFSSRCDYHPALPKEPCHATPGGTTHPGFDSVKNPLFIRFSENADGARVGFVKVCVISVSVHEARLGDQALLHSNPEQKSPHAVAFTAVLIKSTELIDCSGV